MNEDTAVIILSGGKNSRMNHNTKAFLKINNERFIDRIIRKVDDFDEIIISCNDLNLYKEFSYKYSLIEDEIKDIGPIGGIYSCLKQIKSDKALVVASDMPFINKNIVNSMSKIEFKGDAMIAVHDGNEEPLCSIYKKSSLIKIEALIKEKNYKLKNLIRALDVTYMFIEDKTSMININTPDQYKKGVNNKPTIINVVASSSNVGKTTVIEGIIKELCNKGYSVSTIKHDVHGFDIDKEGKDTWKHRKAGANTVSISSNNRFAMIKELKKELDLDEIINMNNDSDFIIVEGYKKSKLRKIEVIRKEITEEIITPKDKLIAVASNFNIDGIRCVNINNYKELSELIEKERFG